MGVTEYLGQTKESVSQTLKVFEKKALIVKSDDENDRRAAHMTVAQKGQALINKVLPSPSLQSASNLLSDQDIAQINVSLGTLISTVQMANNFKFLSNATAVVTILNQQPMIIFVGSRKSHSRCWKPGSFVVSMSLINQSTRTLNFQYKSKVLTEIPTSFSHRYRPL